jgi:hypothetical protein
VDGRGIANSTAPLGGNAVVVERVDVGALLAAS